jgi:hypothetical protein
MKLARLDRGALDQCLMLFPHGLRPFPERPGARQNRLRPRRNLINMAHVLPQRLSGGVSLPSKGTTPTWPASFHMFTICSIFE